MKKILFLLAALSVLQLKIILPDTIATSASDTLQSLTAKLESWDVEMIWPEVKKALAKHPQSADLLEIAAQIAFYRGDYPEALP